MIDIVETLVRRLSEPSLSEASVIPWSSPVPVFGQIHSSHVATLGLNPSNREFVSDQGSELDGHSRRFETLKSLRLKCWADAEARHARKIWDSCQSYFSNRPYDRWFKRLDAVISGTGASYYSNTASHLDLIPFATASKWADLSRTQRDSLFVASGDSLVELLQRSQVRALILNGSSVVAHFGKMFEIQLKRQLMQDWTLRSGQDSSVPGYAYFGRVRMLAGVSLAREIVVLGFNHNIQSSFGVRRDVTAAIQRWLEKMYREHLC